MRFMFDCSFYFIYLGSMIRLLEPMAPRTSGVNYSSVVHSISETWRPTWEVLGNSSATPARVQDARRNRTALPTMYHGCIQTHCTAAMAAPAPSSAAT